MRSSLPHSHSCPMGRLSRGAPFVFYLVERVHRCHAQSRCMGHRECPTNQITEATSRCYDGPRPTLPTSLREADRGLASLPLPIRQPERPHVAKPPGEIFPEQHRSHAMCGSVIGLPSRLPSRWQQSTSETPKWLATPRWGRPAGPEGAPSFPMRRSRIHCQASPKTCQ